MTNPITFCYDFQTPWFTGNIDWKNAANLCDVLSHFSRYLEHSILDYRESSLCTIMYIWNCSIEQQFPLSNVCFSLATKCSLISHEDQIAETKRNSKGSEENKMFDSADKYKSEFENVRQIGSGKFGTVHQVRNVHSGDVFAAKVVK